MRHLANSPDLSTGIVLYDVDSVADVRKLISIDTAIADKDVIGKITSPDLNDNDLLLVKKRLTGGMKIVDVNKVDPAFITSYLK